MAERPGGIPVGGLGLFAADLFRLADVKDAADLAGSGGRDDNLAK